MCVANDSIRPPAIVTHLLCVPGRTKTPSAASSAPNTCVSSPRMTSGTPLASTQLTPGTIASRAPPASTHASPRVNASNPAGHAA